MFNNVNGLFPTINSAICAGQLYILRKVIINFIRRKKTNKPCFLHINISYSSDKIKDLEISRSQDGAVVMEGVARG